MSTEPGAGWAAGLNLLVPGAGIILLGRVWMGLIVGLLFVLCANFALWSVLLVPDEFLPWMRGLGIGLAGGSYVGAQIRLAQTVRGEKQRCRAEARRAALAAAQDLTRQGAFAAALRALQPVRDSAEHDLLIAYRLAQVHTGMQDVEAAEAAWRRVRVLDRHGIYREETHAAEQTLSRLRRVRSLVPGLPPDEG